MCGDDSQVSLHLGSFFFPAESLLQRHLHAADGKDYTLEDVWHRVGSKEKILVFPAKFVMLSVVNSIRRKFHIESDSLWHLGVFFFSAESLYRGISCSTWDKITILEECWPFTLVVRREICLPAEVCYVISGQLYKKKLRKNWLQESPKFSMRQPKERLQTIEAGHGTKCKLRKQRLKTIYNLWAFKLKLYMDLIPSSRFSDAACNVAPSHIKINGQILLNATLFFAGNQWVCLAIPNSYLVTFWNSTGLNVDDGAWNIMRSSSGTQRP